MRVCLSKHFRHSVAGLATGYLDYDSLILSGMESGKERGALHAVKYGEIRGTIYSQFCDTAQVLFVECHVHDISPLFATKI